MCGALGDFASAEATGALPLDPAAFEKAGETFIFLFSMFFHFVFLFLPSEVAYEHF